MKRLIFPLVFVILATGIHAQNRALKQRPKPSPRQAAEKAVVIDERLAVLRDAPGLFATPLKRLRRGGIVTLVDAKVANDVLFVRVVASAKTVGWIQRDALARRSSKSDEQRLARMILAGEGFERLERSQIFLQNYPDSPFRPAVLLFVGDVIEENAQLLSRDAARRLKNRDIAASGAPLHSFYLNFARLDRYRRIGFGFVFNESTRRFHYDGAAWREIVRRFPASDEAVQAAERLAALKEKMEATE